jgi:signal transduction histidine kinase
MDVDMRMAFLRTIKEKMILPTASGQLLQFGPLLNARSWRAMLELVPIQFIVFLASRQLFTMPNQISSIPAIIVSPESAFVVIYCLCSLLWMALRWRLSPPGRAPWKQILFELEMMGAFFLEVPLSLAVFAKLFAPTFLDYVNQSSQYVRIIYLALLLASSFGFLFIHLFLHVLRFWEQIRKTRLRWMVTHSHLMVVVISASLISFLLVLLLSFTNPGHPTIVSFYLILVNLLVILIITAIATAFVLPLSILSSYLFTRRISRRIEELAIATSVLRAGNYRIRITVEGNDEIAHLQSDFNAMAIELERTMRELKEERDNVQTLLHARRELIASVSHELRTPVATVRSYLESALASWQDGLPPESLKNDFFVIQQQTIRLQSLINDLFTLARAEVGQLEMRREPTSANLVVSRVVDTTAPMAWRSSRVEVLPEIAEVSPTFPRVFVDQQRLEQILYNLIHNSIRHTPPGGIIVVSADVDEQFVQIQVKDTGEGIAEEELPHIWDRFYRAQNSGSRPGTGTGLGLAIVKELTEAMSGTVAVESTVGQGTCFTLRFPVDHVLIDDVSTSLPSLLI